MGEIDTKPIESVQAALCYFGEKNEHRKLRSPGRDLDPDKHKDLDELQKELANYKVQLEAKRSEHMQSQLNLEHYQKTVRELSAKLEDCEAERDACIGRLNESGGQVEKLEIEMKQMAYQLCEALKVKEQLSHVYSELKSAQTELISMAEEFASDREWTLQRVSELDEELRLAKLAAAESELRNAVLLMEKDGELQSARAQFEAMRNQATETVQELEHQLLSKSLFIDSLQSELQQARELNSRSEEAAAEAVETIDQLKAKLEAEEGKATEQLLCIEALNMEQGLLRMELKNSVEDTMLLNRHVEKLREELESAKDELSLIRDRENGLQIEIAKKLKADSKIASAEATKAIEAEEGKTEKLKLKLKLKQEVDEVTDKSPDCDLSATENNFTFQTVGGSDYIVTISLEEYESLLAKAKKADQRAAHPHDKSATSDFEIRDELQILKKEHEAAMVKVNEFRTRAEQAVTRAESAERAKLAVEGQLRKWREKMQRRKAAQAALIEETLPTRNYQPIYDDRPVAKYQPLGKVLNMKF